MAYRHAACNELFKNQPIADVCAVVREVGYQGVEIAPFTLAADPVTLTREERRQIRDQIAASGLEFVGLHWLLAAPEGLHATARDKNIRRRTWNYVDEFLDLCADLGDEGIVVFGSPKQRSSRDGMSASEATDAFIEGIANAARHAENRNVTLLVEALSPDQSDVVTSLGEAVAIVKQINSPAVRTMFDVHNAVAENGAHVDLIRQHFPYIRHVHVNEMDGREPGTGDYDFPALLSCLTELNYRGWISLEAFDFSRDSKEIIARSLNHLSA